MEKKMKMWIAIGVVVMLISVSVMWILYSSLPSDDPMYVGEIKMDVSENETAFIINITEVKKTRYEDKEQLEPIIDSGLISLGIRRNDTHWYVPISSESSINTHGIEWTDTDNNDGISMSDKIIIYKLGGVEYIPKEGDSIFFMGMPHAISIKSDGMKLP